jgi:hypothetical protein
MRSVSRPLSFPSLAPLDTGGPIQAMQKADSIVQGSGSFFWGVLVIAGIALLGGI